ncbi:MAG: WD40/YVTN/BNR-like repeat-containing protein, partial [Actinomycetota bacterium]
LNKKKPEIIYAGTDNNILWKTTDNGLTWNKIEHKVLPNRWITNIVVKLNNPNVVYVTYNGFRNGDRTPYVVKSTNGGKRWRNISKNLPQAPVNDAHLVGRKLFVASDLGVFVTKTKRIRWLKLGRGLPNVPVNVIRYVPKNKSIYAGTFGRGVWKVRAPRRF